MNKSFIRTNNYNRMTAAVDALRDRDPSLPGLGLIFGKWGYGKSEAVDHFYGESDIFYIVIKRLWRPRRMLEELCQVLNLGSPEYRLDRLSDQVAAGLRRWGKPLFVDEADYLFKNGIMLDVLRDLHDSTRTPIILIGMETMCDKLRKYGQFFSRILPAGIVEFEQVNPPEIILITREWTGLTLDMATAELFCHYVQGDFRYVVGYLLSLEQACKTNQTNTITAPMVEAVVKKVEAKTRRLTATDIRSKRITGRGNAHKIEN